MASHISRHAGVPESLRQLTQVSFLVRLIALLIGMLVSLGQPLTLPDVLGLLVVGGLSIVGLMQTRLLDMVRRHPMIAQLDALLLAAVVALDGSDSPLVLAALTTALLVGLWVDPRAGIITVVPLVLLYLVGLAQEPLPAERAFVSVVIIPFVYLTLWALGVVVARSTARQRVTDDLVRDAVVAAATSEERTKVARELHDSLAKTLQGLTLTAAALPTLVTTHPQRAEDAAGDIQQMGALAVSQVRAVMTGLRTSTSELPLHTAVAHLVATWRQGRVGPVSLDIEEVDTADEAVRFELLAVLEEALDNVTRHAGPTAVAISLRLEGCDLVLTVEDFGKGSDTDRVEAAGRAGHHGVAGMQERLARVGGRCLWVSRPGHGTRVECRVQRDGLVERDPGGRT